MSKESLSVPSWLGQMLGCVIDAHNPRFDSYCLLNALDYLVLVVVDVVSTSMFGSQCGGSSVNHFENLKALAYNKSYKRA